MDPDETAHYDPPHLDLQCLQIQLLLCFSTLRVKIFQDITLVFRL